MDLVSRRRWRFHPELDVDAEAALGQRVLSSSDASLRRVLNLTQEVPDAGLTVDANPARLDDQPRRPHLRLCLAAGWCTAMWLAVIVADSWTAHDAMIGCLLGVLPIAGTWMAERADTVVRQAQEGRFRP